MELRDSPPARRPGEWVTHSTLREVYSSWWMSLRIDDVERPDGTHTEYEVVRGPDAAGVIALDPRRGILMIYRHRFLPATWGWEIPGGALEPGERPEVAARREFEEETGWSVVGKLHHLSTHHPSVGLVNQTFHIYLADQAEELGAPTDTNEAAAVMWRSFEEVVDDLQTGAISDGYSQLALALALTATGNGDRLRRPGNH